MVRNLALRVALEGGASGWGEIAILPPITVEDEAGARAALEEEAGRLPVATRGNGRRIAAGLLERRAAFGSVRAGLHGQPGEPLRSGPVMGAHGLSASL